jgi:hypothetical protein
MERQEEQMSEIVQVIKSMNADFEKRMMHVVFAALSREKEKVQELTHGRVYPAAEAPLADEDGNLPFGGKVQLGGPLDRLHHVEVTVQQMVSALDTILDHIQKDPTAKHLFHDDDSETSTIIENNLQHDPNDGQACYPAHEEDTQMHTREYSGSKRQLSNGASPQKCHSIDPNTQPSPKRSPPSKKEHSEINNPSADPDHIDRERGST